MTEESKPVQPDQSQLTGSQADAEQQTTSPKDVGEDSEVGEASTTPAPSIESRLPRKFLADDPEFTDRRTAQSGNRRILIPDGKGGMQVVDELIVKVEHNGEMIELVALPEDQRRRRQQIVNLLSIAVGALFLLIFFWLFF